MSSQTDRVAAYRANRRIEAMDAMAVAVQIMVPADVAGVCFTRHPANPDLLNACLVEAVWGLGEGLVSGEFSPDRYEIDRTTGSFGEHVMPQESMWAATPGPAGGIAVRPVPAHQQSARKMSACQLQELLQIALDLEAIYEHPCDIEFAIAGEVLYLLQCRPITTLRRPAG